MKSLQATCIVGALAFTGMIYQFVGTGRTEPDAMPESAASAETPGLVALSGGVSEASVGPGKALGAEPGSVHEGVAERSVMAKASISNESIRSRSVGLGHHDAAEPLPATRDASDDASHPAPGKQDFQYLTYYVWSELPPPEKPADIVLNSLKDIPVGTPIEEIKRASDAFGLDFNFMKAVAKVESDFNPKQRTGS
jgi:hypothetical protein